MRRLVDTRRCLLTDPKGGQAQQKLYFCGGAGIHGCGLALALSKQKDFHRHGIIAVRLKRGGLIFDLTAYEVRHTFAEPGCYLDRHLFPSKHTFAPDGVWFFGRCASKEAILTEL